jgi:hypothetical protein
MPSDKGAAFLLPEVGQPLPGEEALTAHDYVVAIRGKDSPKRCGRRRPILMDQNRAALSEDTDVQGTCRSINAALLFMLRGVEIHPGLLLGGVNFGSRHHTAAHHGRGGLDEYQTPCSGRGPACGSE